MKPTFQRSHRPHHGGPAIASLFRRCGTVGSLGLASVLILLVLCYAAAQGRHDGGNTNNSGGSIEVVQKQPVLQPKPAAHVVSSIEVSRPTDGQSEATVQHNISLKPQRITLGGRQVLYQFPPNDSRSQQQQQPPSPPACSNHHGLRGVLFLYHGCTRTAMSFFYSPQGRDVMRTALSAGLAVVAFEKEGSCWSSSRDLGVSINIGREWIDTYLVDHCGGDDFAQNHDKIPIFGFGASSGGSFVAEVAEATTKQQQKKEGTKGYQFAAINVQIMTPHVAIQTPTVFTVMSRDAFTMQGAEHIVSELKMASVPTLITKTNPKRITVEYLLDRFRDDETFTKDVAKGIVSNLQQMGAIAEDGDLIQNPRSIDLDPLFAQYPKASGGAFGVSAELWEMMTPSEREDASELWLLEELNVAYDQHEITCEKFDDVIEFFFLQSQGGVL